MVRTKLRVRAHPGLDVVPVLHCLAVLESEYLEADVLVGEVVFGVSKDEVSVLKRPDDLDAR